MTHHNDILFKQINEVGIIILNRPKALNAINFHMVKLMTQKLLEWAEDSSIKAVIIKGEGEKAFCAGGDIRAMYQAKQSGHLETLSDFYAHEYNLNYLIHSYPKPYIALLNGITMGGGAGVSIHGSYRIGTEKLTFAMPETSIGFFPDIGGSYFLSRCPNAWGLYLGLSGEKIGPESAFDFGLITHYVSSKSMASLEKALCDHNWGHDAHNDVKAILQTFHQTPNLNPLKPKESLISSCFGHKKGVSDIILALQSSKDVWGGELAQILLKKSPTSLQVTHKQISLGKNYTLQECLEMEYRLSQRFMLENEFFEGVRALLVDKDQNPQWQPKSLAEITPQKLDAYFAPLPKGQELQIKEHFDESEDVHKSRMIS